MLRTFPGATTRSLTVRLSGRQVSAFKDQTAVVTGGGSGVGSAVALALANAGAKIGLIGRRLDLLESVAAKVRIMGSEATCYPADLASSSSQLDVMQQLKRDLPHVDILIQSAGVHFAEIQSRTLISQILTPSIK